MFVLGLDIQERIFFSAFLSIVSDDQCIQLYSHDKVHLLSTVIRGTKQKY